MSFEETATRIDLNSNDFPLVQCHFLETVDCLDLNSSYLPLKQCHIRFTTVTFKPLKDQG